MLDDHLASDPPNRGWNRASIIFWSRRPYRPRISAEDRRLPTDLTSVRLAATCAATAACVAAVCVWPPLFIASVFVRIDGPLFGAVLAGAALLLAVVFYFWVAREPRADAHT